MSQELLYDYESENEEVVEASKEPEEPQKKSHKKLIICISAAVVVALICLLFILISNGGSTHYIIKSMQGDKFSYDVPNRFVEFTKKEYSKVLYRDYDGADVKFFDGALAGEAQSKGDKIFTNDDQSLVVIVRKPSLVNANYDAYAIKYGDGKKKIGKYLYYKDSGEGYWDTHFFTNGMYEVSVTLVDFGYMGEDLDEIAKGIIQSYKMPSAKAHKKDYKYADYAISFTVPKELSLSRTNAGLFFFALRDEDLRYKLKSRYDRFTSWEDTVSYYALMLRYASYDDEDIRYYFESTFSRDDSITYTRYPYNKQSMFSLTITSEDYWWYDWYIDEDIYVDPDIEENDTVYNEVEETEEADENENDDGDVIIIVPGEDDDPPLIEDRLTGAFDEELNNISNNVYNEIFTSSEGTIEGTDQRYYAIDYKVKKSNKYNNYEISEYYCTEYLISGTEDHFIKVVATYVDEKDKALVEAMLNSIKGALL